MKATTLALAILSALLLVPTGAFARDKHRDYDNNQARIEADRRANGYYNPVPYCAPAPYCAPVRVYDNCRPVEYGDRYYNGYDRRDQGGVWVRIR